MLELLKRADAESLDRFYYIKLFADTETKKFSVYANNSNFSWGFNHVFDTKEEAESDFYDTLKRFDYYKWEVK